MSIAPVVFHVSAFGLPGRLPVFLFGVPIWYGGTGILHVGAGNYPPGAGGELPRMRSGVCPAASYAAELARDRVVPQAPPKVA